MKWNDIEPNFNVTNKRYLQTDVECPNCGDMLVQRTDVVLTSNPPQYIYECKKCGWTGCNYGVR